MFIYTAKKNKMGKVADLTINSHNFVFSNMKPYIKDLVMSYCRKLILYDIRTKRRDGKVKLIKKSVFVSVNVDKSNIRFHINHKKDLLAYLKREGYSEENFNIILTPVYQGKEVIFPIKDTRDPYDDQIPVIDYIIEPGKTKTVTMGTGYGKTFVALKAIATIGRRIIIIILSRYVKKWIKDVEEAFHLKKGDLLVIRGSKDLINIMNLALANELTAKIIICTTTTMQRYIKDYELVGSKRYPIDPPDLFPTLDVGLKLVDECHQFFHLNFKIEQYTHITKSLFLSATLNPSDSFINKMYKVVYPLESRMRGKVRDKYIDVTAISYRVKGADRVTCQRAGAYSHVAYENQIIRNKKRMMSYLDMIWSIVKDSFLEVKKDGQKMIIFASTIDMCLYIKDFISERVKNLTVRKYTAEDPQEHLHESDIIVSTLGSAGTAVDIIDLKTCLMTTSISSVQQNIQALGRLRRLVNFPGDNPEFIYIYSLNIKKQLQYHKTKFHIFKDLCRSHTNYDSKYVIDFRLNTGR